MLRLEINDSDKQIVFKTSEKRSFFTPLLCQAFGLALGIHLAIFLIFSVEVFKLNSIFLYPPIQVKTDENLLSKPVALIEDVMIDSQDPFAPPLIAFLEEFPYSKPDYSIDFMYDLLNSVKSYSPSYYEGRKSFKTNPVKIYISGEAANRKLLKFDPILNIKVVTIPSREPVYVSFKIKIDDSGTVFYDELKDRSGDLKMNLFARELLAGLEFEKGHSFLQETGIVHFAIDKEWFENHKI